MALLTVGPTFDQAKRWNKQNLDNSNSNILEVLMSWTSYHLENFYFHCLGMGFEFFPLVPPRNNENKSCLNELKFRRASENHKTSICWKFQLSISCGNQREICQDNGPLWRNFCQFHFEAEFTSQCKFFWSFK